MPPVIVMFMLDWYRGVEPVLVIMIFMPNPVCMIIVRFFGPGWSRRGYLSWLMPPGMW